MKRSTWSENESLVIRRAQFWLVTPDKCCSQKCPYWAHPDPLTRVLANPVWVPANLLDIPLPTPWPTPPPPPIFASRAGATCYAHSRLSAWQAVEMLTLKVTLNFVKLKSIGTNSIDISHLCASSGTRSCRHPHDWTPPCMVRKQC